MLFRSLKYDILSVIKAIRNDRLLQLMIPYQICFGLSAGFIGYYINKNVVAIYLGDGYIGLLTALSTFCAALLSYPFALISNYSNGRGKWYIMIFGSICFCLTGFIPLLYSNKILSKWENVILYYLIHGAARGCWENTNKAVIVDYFPNHENRDTAFSAVYFSSGLSGALGYYFYKYMSRDCMVLINFIIPLIALISYHFSDKIYYDTKLDNDINRVNILRDNNNNCNDDNDEIEMKIREEKMTI